jgi:hypothetical protein
MPKLDGTHIVERLRERLEKLQSGEEVAARDIKLLLSKEQKLELENAKTAMRILKHKKRARTRDEEVKFGWKSIREMHIEALKQALNAAQDNELAAWEKRLNDAEIRQGRVYFDELKKETDAGVDLKTAKTRANNALTRAKLRRLDGQVVGHHNVRDIEVWEIEQKLIQSMQSEMTDDEREQLELLREYEKAVLENRKKRGG